MNYDTLKLVFSLFIAPLADSEGDLPGPGLPLASEGVQQLYALSKVCKAFHEPALDCLWHNLPGIEPLLKLHPALTVINGAYVGPATLTGVDRMIMRTPVSPADRRR
jgi:hypothetical protein